MSMFQAALAFANVNRQRFKNALVLGMCAAMVFFLCTYAAGIKANQQQLMALPDSLPVRGFVSNLNGSRSVGLLINGAMVEQVEASGQIRNMLYTIRMPATYAPVQGEEPQIIYIMGFNTLRPYPSIQLDSMEHSEAFFAGQSAQCIVSRRFLSKYHLSVGDAVPLELYRHQQGEYPGEIAYEYIAPDMLMIADTFDSNAVTADMDVLPDILVPIGWAKIFFEKWDSPFYYDSVSFDVQNPLKLNEFKAMMRAQRLVSVNPQASDSITGSALVLRDETFIRSATGIQSNLTLHWMFAPFLAVAVLLTGAVLSHVMMHSRKGEFAVMRLLGMAKRSCLQVYVMECGLVALAGALVGVAAALLFTGASLFVSLVAAAIFWAAYTLGAAAAVQLLGRKSVTKMLCSEN